MNWQCVPKPNEGCAQSFKIVHQGVEKDAFVICFHGHFYAYENRCPHLGTTLDWVEGMFFSEGGEHLVCQTHGALFQPENGVCLSGPCAHGLTELKVRVDDIGLWVQQ